MLAADKPVAELLPSDLREALIRASQIKDPMARRAAIDAAELQARLRRPDFYRKEQPK